ncbi:MAG TPA: zinc transporter ZntB [Marinobacterium sp.]|nr:zinc transporter ZntB [Marinobacterium sp.]
MENRIDEFKPLHALLLDTKGGARELSYPEIQGWTPEQGMLWIHIDYTDQASATWLAAESGLASVAVDALLAENTRPRALQLDHSLLLALRGVNLNRDADPYDMVSVRICIQSNRLISTRRRRLQSVTELVEALHNGTGPETLSDLVVSMVDGLTLRIGDQVMELDNRLELLEESMSDNQRLTQSRQELMELRNIISRLRRYLSPQREAFIQLQSERLTLLDAQQKNQIRETQDALLRHIEDLDLMREKTIAAHDALLASLSDQLNSRMYLLSIISGLFLPLGFFTGLLGVNVGGMPGADNPMGFWIFCGALVVMGLGMLWLLKRLRWF